MTETLTFTAYCDLVLARLYEAEREAERNPGTPAVINVDDLMADITEQGVPEGWAWDAAAWIINQGFGHDYLTDQTATTALTPDGRIYVEAERGTGIIGRYHQGSQFVVVTGDGNQVAVGHGQTVTQAIQGDLSKEEISDLLDEAETALQADTTLTNTDRQDALADVTSMRTQIAKAAPNRQALTALAAGLASVASLADTADKIHQALG
jgi:hypothetical protein